MDESPFSKDVDPGVFMAARGSVFAEEGMFRLTGLQMHANARKRLRMFR
ncbi:MAG: hypothetical protein AVDCRST_MAG02-4027 [uncultured Rubrobacteraceae bacterium]|uniref:Uncharacterized protein n=1 Tax=uncultured Rubrobacteraceae bacterium TaxID=349277 RepID=A0A6J4RI72_9ACTN|nr:MAG: hypothetical protein AVDCRST_MAG02-4027 [uncultured Rubrobacteraceae bacterium]